MLWIESLCLKPFLLFSAKMSRHSRHYKTQQSKAIKHSRHICLRRINNRLQMHICISKTLTSSLSHSPWYETLPSLVDFNLGSLCLLFLVVCENRFGSSCFFPSQFSRRSFYGELQKTWQGALLKKKKNHETFKIPSILITFICKHDCCGHHSS